MLEIFIQKIRCWKPDSCPRKLWKTYSKGFVPTVYVLCASGGKKYSFFGKFDVLCFLETPVLRFAILPYYRWVFPWVFLKKFILQVIKEFFFIIIYLLELACISLINVVLVAGSKLVFCFGRLTLIGQHPMKSLSSFCLSICPSVYPSIHPSINFVKIGSLVFFLILNMMIAGHNI